MVVCQEGVVLLLPCQKRVGVVGVGPELSQFHTLRTIFLAMILHAAERALASLNAPYTIIALYTHTT